MGYYDAQIKKVRLMYINTLSSYLKKTYGCKLYKISLDGGMTCPNRDGKISREGCIFCSKGGSGDFAERYTEDVIQQIEKGKAQIEKKFSNGSYIAYFQSYTNTYGDIAYLRKIFMQALSHPQVKILSIATRPDCIDERVGRLLGELNKIKPIWVELGFQTANEESAEYINRGYKNNVYKRAIDIIRKYDNKGNKYKAAIEIITHMIIGLPNETIKDMIDTVRYINESDVQGIKFQLLHVLKETKLAEIYLTEGFKIYSLGEYIDILFRLIEELKEDIVIHRITGDGPKSILIEPKWTGNKKLVLNTINMEMINRNIIQGSRICRQ